MRCTRGRTIITAGLICLLVAAGTLSADLPKPEPPRNPPKRPTAIQLHPGKVPENNQPLTEEMREKLQRRWQQAEGVGFDLLLKRVADTHRPMPEDWSRQGRQVAAFASLSLDDRNKAIGELLGLLRSTARLPDEDNPETPGKFQVRHRANVALAEIAQICFGRFPVHAGDEKLSPEQVEQDRKTSQQLIARWADWWEQAQPLDIPQRLALAKRLRRPLIDQQNDELFWPNVRYAEKSRDVYPLPYLKKMLAQADPMDKQVNRILSTYANLCQAPDAPPLAALALIDFLKKHNTPQVARKSQVLRRAVAHLRRITRIYINYFKEGELEIKDGDQVRTVKVNIIDPEAIETWEKAIKGVAEETAKPADEQ